MTSNAPPRVSPFSRARSISSIIRRSTSGSTQRSGRVGGQGRRALEGHGGALGETGRANSPDVAGQAMPARASSWRAIAPAATRDAVSRALARSRMSRMSARPYFATPARSAWPGRGRVTGARFAPARVRRDLRRRVHRPLPVRPVAVLDHHRDRAAHRLAGAHAREDLRAIGLDLHPPSAAVAALPAAKLRRDRVDVHGKPGGNAFEDDDERAAVRFAGGEKSHHLCRNCIRTFYDIRPVARSIRAGNGSCRARRTACSSWPAPRCCNCWPIGSSAIVAAGSTSRPRVRSQSASTASRPERAQFEWNDRCATLSRLRHPLLNPLLDYGYASADALLRGVREPPAVPRRQRSSRHAPRPTSCGFFVRTAISLEPRARTTRSSARSRLAAADRDARSAWSYRNAACSTRLADVLDGGGTGPVSVSISGPPRSGLTTVRQAFARTARLAGYVPVCVEATSGGRNCSRSPPVGTSASCLETKPRPTRTPRARWLARLGVESTRRHLHLDVRPPASAAPGRAALWIPSESLR